MPSPTCTSGLSSVFSQAHACTCTSVSESTRPARIMATSKRACLYASARFSLQNAVFSGALTKTVASLLVSLRPHFLYVRPVLLRVGGSRRTNVRCCLQSFAYGATWDIAEMASDGWIARAAWAGAASVVDRVRGTDVADEDPTRVIERVSAASISCAPCGSANSPVHSRCPSASHS